MALDDPAYAGEQHDRQGFAGRKSAQLRRQLLAVHDRHRHVDDCHVIAGARRDERESMSGGLGARAFHAPTLE